MLAIFATQTNQTRTGFDKEVSAIIFDFNEFIRKYNNCFQDNMSQIEHFDFFSPNSFLTNSSSVSNLSTMFLKLDKDKNEMYLSLKAFLENTVRLNSQSMSFDLSFDDEVRNMIHFIVGISKTGMSKTLQYLFNDFVKSKNLFFFTVGELKMDVRNLIVNTVNFFDATETFMSKFMVTRGSKTYNKLSSSILVKDPYVLGYFDQFINYHRQEVELVTRIAQKVITLQTDLMNYDDAIFALFYYYDSRYVFGKSDAEIIQELNKKIANMQIDVSKSQFKYEDETKIDSENENDANNLKNSKKNGDDDDDSKGKNNKNGDSDSDEANENQDKSVSFYKDLKELIKSISQEDEQNKKKSDQNQKKEDEQNKSKEDENGENQNVDNEETDILDNTEPIKICDKTFLNNYFLEGIQVAKEVDPSIGVSPCNLIEYTCCSQAEISRAYESYRENQLVVLEKNYEIVESVLNTLLMNFKKFNKLAYKVFRSKQSSSECKKKARNVIMTPISKDYNDDFAKKMKAAHEFSAKTKSNYICLVCDYSFHKQILETSEMPLSKQYCQSLMESNYKFLMDFHMVLVDYLNNVSNMLQCNPETGEFEVVSKPTITTNTFISEVLLKCSGSKNMCHDLCELFSFTSLDSDLELNSKQLREYFQWIKYKMTSFNSDIEEEYETSAFGLFWKDYVVEKSSQLANRSIPNLTQKFLEESSDELVYNPYQEGGFIYDVLSVDDANEE